MSRRLLTGNAAAAWAARLARVDYIPAFPITPQTEIIESLANWIDNGEMAGRLVTLESEHSMLTAAGAAAATGVRVYSATSSQGLLYGMEMLYNVAGWRTPFVLTNVSRGLSAPITLEADHNDILAARDSGCLQIHCATCQEVLDSTLMAYRLAEDERVRLPVIVNMDGFYLSFTREPVLIPAASDVDAFLPPFDPENIAFRASAPASQAVAVLGGSPYSYFRYEMHLAAMQALEVYEEIATKFAEKFGRRHDAVEAYHCEDAEIVLVMMGSFATKARAAVDQLRAAGQAVGLLRPRLLRPFPAAHLQRLLAGKQGVVVIDQNLSMGKGGVLHAELASVLYGRKDAPPILTSFIGGLGGRDITAEEFFEMVKVTREAVASGNTPPPRLLYNRDELREVHKLQAIAHVEREELGKGGDKP
ncbi:pyruvate synthase [Sulfuriflexus mobilis]|uniref:pyruvate synthase n=1 Tax=Sulfuriflexus mobilis TaxID=1811807 RepID=UPI000F81CC21|nr:pyruvate synthase [Sulfuriflexus mobilis]